MGSGSGRVSNVVVTKPAINLYYKQSSVLIPCNLPAVATFPAYGTRRFLATRFQFNSLERG